MISTDSPVSCQGKPVSMHGVLSRLFRPGAAGPISDGQLLSAFILQKDGEAFAQIVHRHGPMVLGVCRRLAGNTQDADDAFQATFLVLVRRAECVHPREMLGPWLHGVACRTARSVRAAQARRWSRQQPLEEANMPAASISESTDWLPFLDREIARLPETYRRPVVLCELQGKSRREAARMLGVAEGTLSSRLASARKKLASRLGRRGLLSVALPVSWAAMNSSASAAVPPHLESSTVQLGLAFLERSTQAAIPTAVASLSHGVIQSMFWSQCKSLALVAMLLSCFGGGLLWLGSAEAGDEAAQARHDPLALAQPGDDDEKHEHAKKHGKHDDTKHTNKHNETITGSGNIITETRKVSGFTALRLENAGEITIKQTGKEKLTITTDDNLMPLLQTEVQGKGLVLKNSKDNINLKPTKKIEYTIEVKSLGQLEILGAGKLTITDYDGKQLLIRVAGAGTLHLQGKADELAITVPGAGEVDATRLTAKVAHIEIAGSGNINLHAEDALGVKINGAGSVHYLGDPKVTKSISGVGTVKKASGNLAK